MTTKRILTILAVVMLLGICPVRADFIALEFSSGYNTYDEGYGHTGEVWVRSSAILDVLGGEITGLRVREQATVNLYSGDIYEVLMMDNSVANIHGGEINGWLVASDDSLVYLYAYDVMYHLTGGGTWGNMAWIEGNYLSNDAPFNFCLVGGAYSHITVIPEPATLFLLGLGSLLILRKK